MTTKPPDSRQRPPDRGVTARRAARGWSWNDVNVILDACLLVVFAALCGAAAIVRFVFPPGPVAGGWRLWGLDYDAWGGILFGLLALLAGGVLVHVMLHWSWVCNVLASRFLGAKSRVDEGLQTIYGVGLLIGLLLVVGAVVAAAKLSVTIP